MAFDRIKGQKPFIFVKILRGIKNTNHNEIATKQFNLIMISDFSLE
jgi:hypothetical protein